MKHYLMIIAAMCIWSTWGLMIRWLALPGVVILFYASLIAGCAVPLVLKFRGEFNLSGALKGWWLHGSLAAASITNNLTYFYSLGHTTVSNAVFTHYTAPLFVALLAPVMISERLQRVTLISLPLAAAGMALIVLASNGFEAGGEHTGGLIAGTASGVAYALLIIISRRLSQRMMHHQAVVILLWITAVVTAPAAVAAGHPQGFSTIALLLIAGLIHSTIAPLLYFSALRHVLAQHAAILGYIEPLAAVPLAFLFLSEEPALSALFGGMLILFSGYLVVRSRRSGGG